MSQNLQENTCARVSLLIKLQAWGNFIAGLRQLYLKKTLTQVFSCEFCKIFKNIFLIEHVRWLAASGKLQSECA